jgi:hypothetical protein
MKVKDAIKQLLKEDPEAILIVGSNNPELGQADVEAKYIHTYKGKFEEQHCRDMMDGTPYETEVIRRDEEGKKTFVKIS